MAVLSLLACLAAVVLFDRACLHATSASIDLHPEAARKPSASPPASSLTSLSAGACKALKPTGKSRDRVIFIDPGHGGLDPGVAGRSPTGTPLKESVVALAVADELSRQLRADGYGVVLSRSADTSVLSFDPGDTAGGSLTSTQVRQDLQARVRCANGSRASVLVSIHFNGFQDPAVGGTLTIYDTARPFAADNLRLAQSLQGALVSRLELTDRGLLTDDALVAPTLSERAGGYGHLLLLGPPEPGWLDQGTAMAGALVEPLFLTAPAEAALAASPAGQKRIASAIAAGLTSYLSGAPAHQRR